MNSGWVYIMSNKNKNVFYVGVTNNLERRVFEHKTVTIEGFTKKYNCKELVYYEEFQNITDAISREKQLKNWHREWKINLIKSLNSDFIDLSKEWFDLETLRQAQSDKQ